MSGAPDAGVQLERALILSGHAAGIDPVIVAADWTRWASATFTGARHRLSLSAPASPALDQWLLALPELELALRGHLVADLVVPARDAWATFATFEIEALTVEDR